MNKIEAEGSELILKNKAGDHVIIPKKYRQEVLDMIKDNCHSCIDALVETLPIAQDYAQDGTVIINPDDKPVIKKSKVRIENKKVYDQFSEDEIRQFIEEDTRETSETLKAQARYRYYSNLIEQGRFRNDSTYQTFKQNLPSKISDRMQIAAIFAQNNPDFYESDSTVRQRLSQEEYDDYLQTKQFLEGARSTNTQGTDIYSGAHGARSIALDIDPRRGINAYSGKEVEDNKIRTASYRIEYNPTTKDYEYVLLDATKGKKYNK